MFAGVARFVCRPTAMVSTDFVNRVALIETTSYGQPNLQIPADPLKMPFANGTFLEKICGNDTKLAAMVKNHISNAPCKVTKCRGISLEDMLLRDHNIHIDDFSTLSVVNRRILLLDSLKRHNADIPCKMVRQNVINNLTPKRREELLVERGRELLLRLHNKHSK
eukprot:Tbor_TRINITY_DN2162_c0_g2::TRINITY_DN2162_c0_g2_i1::g.5467::m.5467